MFENTLKLAEILTHRAEAPSEVSFAEGKRKIISKIKFATGQIEFRDTIKSRTKLISVEPGDIVFSGINALKGAIAVFPENLGFSGAATIHYSSYYINKELCDVDFLWWFFRLPQFREIAQKYLPGGIKTELKAKRLLEIEIPLPTLGKQRAIAKKLKSTSHKACEIDVLSDDIASELNALVYSLHKTYSEPKLVSFGELLQLSENRISVEDDTEYPQLGIRSFGNGLFFKDATKGSETSYKRFNQVYTGAFIVSQPKGWEGAVAVADNDHHGWYLSPEYRTFRCNEQKIIPSYLAALILTPWFQHELSKMTKGQGARRERLRPEMLTSFQLRMPSLARQKGALEIIDKAKLLTAQISLRKQDFKTLLPALSHRVFKSSAITQKLEAVELNSGDSRIREAALVGAIVSAFQSDGGQPMGNFRLQKAVYFARRHMGEKALDQEYLKKAAGPYNPQMRYSGGIKIANDRNWIVRTSGDFGDGSALGKSKAEMDEWIDKYKFAPIASWVRNKFKYKQNDLWELLATIDYAKLAIEADGSIATSKSILDYIEKDEEWKPKIEKLGLTLNSISNALATLDDMFVN